MMVNKSTYVFNEIAFRCDILQSLLACYRDICKPSLHNTLYGCIVQLFFIVKLGCLTEFESAIAAFTMRGFNQLSYRHHHLSSVVHGEGVEPSDNR